MSLGSWDPDAAQQQVDFKADQSQLERFITLSRDNLLDNLAQHLSAEEQQIQAGWMQLPANRWEAEAVNCSDEDIVHLMRFFTMAEALPGWEAGASSPVIYLGKQLKKRKLGISKDLTLWIRQHSENRYLPHGPLL